MSEYIMRIRTILTAIKYFFYKFAQLSTHFFWSVMRTKENRFELPE